MGQGHTSHDEGVWEVKRKICLPALRHEADSIIVLREVQALPGVCRAEVDLAHQRLAVRYDATRVDFQAIKAALESAGYPPPGNWWTHLKESWYRFVDGNLRDNANAPPPACCNKPPRQRKP